MNDATPIIKNKEEIKSKYRVISSYSPATKVYQIHKYLLRRVILENQDFRFYKDFLSLQNIKVKWIEEQMKKIIKFNTKLISQTCIRKSEI